MSKKISAIIAVRKGSKRVKDKNLRKFGASSLLEIKLSQLIRTKGIGEIIVSSDCEKMLSIAKDMGTTAILRDSKYATDMVPMNTVYNHLATLANYNDILYAHVTSPLLTDDSMQNSIEIYNNMSTNYDSLASVTKLHEYIWTRSGAVNYNPDYHPRSQDLPEYYALNFAINILPKSVMLERSNIVGRNPYPYFLNEIESVDVDTMIDFEIAEFLYNKKVRKNEKL